MFWLKYYEYFIWALFHIKNIEISTQEHTFHKSQP